MSTEASHTEHTDHHADEHDTMTKKKIWNVFFILLGITAIEFIIALYLVPKGIIPIHFANPIYILLTLAKAFYIVAYFMHLKFEKIGLLYTILVPTIFIIGLILVLTNESHHWVDMGINDNLSAKIKKIIILALVLVVPGYIFHLLNEKAKNRYKPLAFFGPKIVAKTGHTFHGTYIPDTLYHHLSDFQLIDQNGNRLSFKNFQNNIFVVSFFYTRCPTVCNEVNKHLDSLVSAYTKNRMVKFISITVDPEHDTPTLLKAYAGKYHEPAGKWLFATGDTTTIYNLARKGLLVNATRTGNDFIYDSNLILVDQDKRIRGYYQGTSPAEVSRLNDGIKVQIAEELRKIKSPEL